jgi:hypothetical protein
MQFGHALECILGEILLANSKHGHVFMTKTDLSDGFYGVGVEPDDVPKLGVIFPSRPGQNEPLMALPLVLPMGWKNSPPIFSTATETIADLANTHLSNTRYHPRRHHSLHPWTFLRLPNSPTTMSMCRCQSLCLLLVILVCQQWGHLSSTLISLWTTLSR